MKKLNFKPAPERVDRGFLFREHLEHAKNVSVLVYNCSETLIFTIIICECLCRPLRTVRACERPPWGLLRVLGFGGSPLEAPICRIPESCRTVCMKKNEKQEERKRKMKRRRENEKKRERQRKRRKEERKRGKETRKKKDKKAQKT